MAATAEVGVVGLTALNRDLKRLAADTGPLNKAMADAGRRAVEPIAVFARSTLPQVSGRLAGDVRVTASRSGAAVRMGRASIRYAGWVEFGGHRMVPWESQRDYQPLGRYLFPAARQLAAVAAADYSAAVTAALNGFDWTNSHADPGSVHD
jgi:hypothetical protein